MAELIVLGSSAGVPTHNRHNTGLLIRTADRMYLFDCGCPVPALMKTMGEDPLAINAVFLTHWHADHTGCLPIFIQDQWIMRRKETLPIYGPEGTQRKVKLLQNIFLLPPDIYPFELAVADYREGRIYDDGYIAVDAFPTGHLSHERWKTYDEKYDHELYPYAFGFAVHCEGKKIIISGDMLRSTDMLPVLDGADLVVHEFGHFQPEEINLFMKEHDVPDLLVTHINHRWNDRTDELHEAISAGCTGRVRIAHDAMRAII